MIKRISTSKAGKGRPAVVIELKGQAEPIEIEHNALATHNTPAKLLAEAEKQAGQVLPSIFFHINRDGSVAIATGAEPAIWPEDEPEELE